MFSCFYKYKYVTSKHGWDVYTKDNRSKVIFMFVNSIMCDKVKHGWSVDTKHSCMLIHSITSSLLWTAPDTDILFQSVFQVQVEYQHLSISICVQSWSVLSEPLWLQKAFLSGMSAMPQCCAVTDFFLFLLKGTNIYSTWKKAAAADFC